MRQPSITTFTKLAKQQSQENTSLWVKSSLRQCWPKYQEIGEEFPHDDKFGIST
jgi:hypothetical protein